MDEQNILAFKKLESENVDFSDLSVIRIKLTVDN